MHELKLPSKIMFSYFDESESILLKGNTDVILYFYYFGCKSNSIAIFFFLKFNST